MIGFVVGRLLWQGTLVPLKCPVVPVSAIAIVGGVGPRGGFAFSLLLVTTVLTVSMLSPGVPLSYSITGTGVSVMTGGPHPRPRPPSRPRPPLPPRSGLWWKGAKIKLHPPCRLVIDALLMCPSLGFLQALPM
jgi:hypothetical protein